MGYDGQQRPVDQKDGELSIEPPKANPENLLGIIREAHRAKVVVPEFQRSFVWARDDVEEFLTSILEGYFVGTFLTLDTNPNDPMFPFRLVEGLEQVNDNARSDNYPTVRLVLDGQQRISSVFYALYEPDIPLRGAKNPYRFFLKLEPALRGNLDESVVGISVRDRRRLSENDKLVEAEKAIRFSLLRDSSAFHKWLYNEQKTWDETETGRIKALYDRFTNFMIPVVALPSETGEDNIVNIFERINRTGIRLGLFDLAGARLYPKGIRLRRLWRQFENDKRELAKTAKPEFLLKIIALLEGKEPRKGNMLRVIDSLDAKNFETRWEQSIEAFTKAKYRIQERYGAFFEGWTPYTTLVVPLASILYELEQTPLGEDAYRKLDRWYWASVFSQRYDSAVDTKTYQDVRDVKRWIAGGSTPEWIERLTVERDDLATEEARSAVYRGLMCLIVKRGARDFMTGQEANLQECQDDHIFPRSQYRSQNNVDVIFNRSLISKHTNKTVKGAKHPSEFVKMFLKGHGGDEQRLKQTLSSHLITEEAYEALKQDNFEDFVEHRAQSLLNTAQAALDGEIDMVNPAS